MYNTELNNILSSHLEYRWLPFAHFSPQHMKLQKLLSDQVNKAVFYCIKSRVVRKRITPREKSAIHTPDPENTS